MAATQYTGVPGSVLAMPGRFVPASIGSIGLPLAGGMYLQAPQGWQPWNIPEAYQVVSWGTETTYSLGYTNPPPANTAIQFAVVNMGTYTLKVWIPLASVQPLG